MNPEQRERLYQEKVRRKTLRTLARFFEDNYGRETRLIFYDPLRSSGSFETIAKGFLVRKPKSENRSSFCIAYVSDVPAYKAGGKESVGNSIFYALLRPEKILNIEDNDSSCRIFTKDEHAMFGGSFFRREDLEKLAELNVFSSLNVNAMSGSYVNERDL